MKADEQQRLTRIALIYAELRQAVFHSRQFAQFASSSVSFLFYLRRSAFICGFKSMSNAKSVISEQK